MILLVPGGAGFMPGRDEKDRWMRFATKTILIVHFV